MSAPDRVTPATSVPFDTPSADDVTAYRRHVDAAVVKFFHEAKEDKLAALAPLVEVGLNHEQQHQELMLTDILHAFAQNPIPRPMIRRGVSRITPFRR